MDSTNYIIIHCFAKLLRYGDNLRNNPKNYPYWEELIKLINQIFPDLHIIQIGVEDEPQLVNDFRKNLSIVELENLLSGCVTWIGIDSFFQHLGWSMKKKGIVLWGKSDPLIFGHKENINLLKNRKYLREKQFWWWEQDTHDKNVFVSPDVVLEKLSRLLNPNK